MDLLTIGQMAQRNLVSKKTLLFYQDKNLIEPDVIDESNGRRYYHSDQSYRLDLIQRLQATGMALDEIRDVLASESESDLKGSLTAQARRIEEQRTVLASAQHLINEMLEGIQMRESLDPSPKTFPAVQIIPYAEVDIWPFALADLDLPPLEMSVHPCSDQWHTVQRAVKGTIEEHLSSTGLDIPAPLLFRRVGGIYLREAAEAGDPLLHTVFAVLEPHLARRIKPATTIPAGNYLHIPVECESLQGPSCGKCACITAGRMIYTYAKKHLFDAEEKCYIQPYEDPLALKRGALETLTLARVRLLDA